MTVPARPFPKPSAQVETYVAILGTDMTIEFLLQFGGAELYIPELPQGRSRLAALIRIEKTKELAKKDRLLQRRVPLANAWIAACLYAKGFPINEIALDTHIR